jgi:hypothetical protein
LIDTVDPDLPLVNPQPLATRRNCRSHRSMDEMTVERSVSAGRKGRPPEGPRQVRCANCPKPSTTETSKRFILVSLTIRCQATAAVQSRWFIEPLWG